VNGRPLAGPTPLHDGDVVTFGRIGLRFTPAGDLHLA
jgi:hypothetical protein